MTATFYVGDAIEVMSELPEKSVDLILTSPPFLALRSYLPADHPDKALEGGSQATPGKYIDWLVDVVEACDRVLAPHGSLCIELGDTYAGSGGAGGDYNTDGLREGQPKFRQNNLYTSGYSGGVHGLNTKKPDGGIALNAGTGWPLAKSLSLIPELFRFTLVYGTNPLTGRTTDRWRLRNVVRWVRPNPPVGNLGDKFRPATSELMVFCKSAKRYFDLDAVRTALVEPDRVPTVSHRLKQSLTKGTVSEIGDPMPQNAGGAPPLDWWKISPGGYEGAHYAVFPPELCIKPIKAMCPEKVCKVCGEPQRRITETARVRLHDGAINPPRVAPTRNDSEDGTTAIGIRHGMGVITVAESWSDCGHGPDCVLPTYEDRPVLVALDTWKTERVMVDPGQCDESHWRPGVVLDPFGGSGTTALVATGHGRDCILIDLDERNYELALQRVGPFILERAG